MTGPVDVDAPTPPTDLTVLLRRPIADPGQFCRRERWPHPDDGDWVYELVSKWRARAAAVALDQLDAAAKAADEAHVDQILADTGLASFEVGDGEARLRLVLAQETAANMCLAFRTLLDANPGADNYVEQTVTDRATGDQYVFIVVKPGGLTPHQLRLRAEAERDELAETGRQIRARVAAEISEACLTKAQELREHKPTTWQARCMGLEEGAGIARAAAARADLAATVAQHQLTPDGHRRVLHPEHAADSWNRRGTEPS